MKPNLALALVPLLVAMGCSAITGGPKLPGQRPPDFRISIDDGGGMLPESEHYFISQDSAGRESFYEQARNRWTFVPDSAQLEAFYQNLKTLNPTDIHAEDQGMVHDRGGISLRMDFDKHHFDVSDAGSSFVVEKDAERFSEVERAVIAFVQAGLEPRKIPCTLILKSDLPHAVKEQNSVHFNQMSVLDWSRPQPTVYEDSVAFSLLPGAYMLEADQTLNGKMLNIREKVMVDAMHHHFQIELKSDTFELKQQQ